MANGSIGLTAETFNQLLDWLGEDRDDAARRYEEIRSRLIRVFVCRGCPVAEDLADQTIDRVAIKLPQISESYSGDRALYFYGVAEKIYLEHGKQGLAVYPPAPDVATAEIEIRYQCLEACMERLSRQNRELIRAYYENGACNNLAARKVLAQRLGLAANALWTRTHRIREGLRRCAAKCFNQKITKEAIL